MDITQLREQLNKTDDALVKAFRERMHIVLEIARYKKENGLQVHDPAREAAVIKRLTQDDKTFADAVETLYRAMFEISRDLQRKFMAE